MEIQVTCVRSRGVRYTVPYVLTIEPKGLGQIFEERRRGRPADRCLQLNHPQKTKHRRRCSPESRRNNGGPKVAQGNEEQVGGELTIRQAYCKRESSSNPTGPRKT